MLRVFTLTVEDQPLFKHRAPDVWLEDILRMARIHPRDYCLCAEQTAGEWQIHISATEYAMRLALVALNLHAAQTPWDTTPADQALALEALWKDLLQ